MPRTFRFKTSNIIVLFLFSVTVLFILSGQLQTNANVIVDFAAQSTETNSMSGILHGIDTTQPPINTVKPLQPKLWRTGRINLYYRVIETGANFQLILSDIWGYGKKSVQSTKSNGWPYEKFDKWEAFVRRLSQENRGKKIIWEVWNEPNINENTSSEIFWKGTKEQFFETYKRAYRVLREQLGSEVMIGGPSLSRYDKDYIVAFLEYCKANDLEVNFLSWHELNDQIIPSIDDHLVDARNSLQENPRYSSLKIKKLYVNEVVGQSAQYRPGEIIGYLYYLEQGRADGASKACWDTLAKDQVSNCFNHTLDGMLTPDKFEPRAAWWTYKAYADGFSSRVQSQSNNPLIVALGSRSNLEGKAQVLLGYFKQKYSPPAATVTVTLKNLQQLDFTKKGQQIHLKLEKIPNTAEQVVKKLVNVKEENVSAASTVQFVIPNFAIHEGYLLTISSN